MMRTTLKLTLVAAALGVGYLYFSSESDSGEPVTQTVGIEQAADDTVTAPEKAQPQGVESIAKAVVPTQSLDRRRSGSDKKGSAVIHQIGEPLDPNTHIPSGSEKLIAIGERLDPAQVYANSGSRQLRALGERVTDVDMVLGRGAPELRTVGEPIPSSQVR